MNRLKHGLSVGMERIDNRFYLSLKAIGTLTHEDYQVITPMVDSALEGVNQPKIDALVDLTELEGWELQAAWDDFIFGLKHGSEFEKIAVVGNKQWQQWASKVGNWFMSGEIEYFEDIQQADLWLHQQES